MIDITEIILNFQEFIINQLKSFTCVGLARGSDEWDDLAELSFDILVLHIIKEKSM
ncbi:MAG: hypothetical protein AB8B66_00770 [Rickettsiaceae bacterium]